jgi:DNA-binding NarL/FixJ family response regulator
MLKNMLDWQVTSVSDSETGFLMDVFGERYDLTPRECEVMRLLVLFGFENEEIIKILKLTDQTLDNYVSCILGKSRTNSIREFQALFIRYLMQKLPA